MSAAEVIALAEDLGVELRAEDGRIHGAPKAAVTDGLRKAVQEHKPELLALLQAPLPVRGTQTGETHTQGACGEARLDPLVVTCYTPRGEPIEVRADDAEHAAWLRRTNPPPVKPSNDDVGQAPETPSSTPAPSLERETVAYKAIREACDGLMDPRVFLSKLIAEDLENIEAGRVPAAYLRCVAHGGAMRLSEPTPDPELRRKVLQQLTDNPETKYAYVVDDPDSDPVIVGFGIRDVGTCEIAIPKERFDPLEFVLAIKDQAGTA
ncbi:MAG: hypothetical protein ACREV4_14935 [Gammaproteobacteria bacterium]